MNCDICGVGTRLNWGDAYTIRCEAHMNANDSSNRRGKYKEKSNGDNDNSTREQEPNSKSSSDERIFSCPSCKQKIRVTLPLQSNKGRCSSCRNTFNVSSDDAGNIYIYGTDENQATYDKPLSIEESFTILNVKKSSAPSEIKRAYKTKMKEYHPDKVATLGEKLKDIAIKETKKINAAYTLLKNNGYC